MQFFSPNYAMELQKVVNSSEMLSTICISDMKILRTLKVISGVIAGEI